MCIGDNVWVSLQMGRAIYHYIRPRILVLSDCGWMSVAWYMGIARDPTTSYHHQYNGKIERMHRSLKTSLLARLLERVNWLSELPWVILGLRAASNLDTGVSPSIFGHCWVTHTTGSAGGTATNYRWRFHLRQKTGICYGSSNIPREPMALCHPTCGWRSVC